MGQRNYEGSSKVALLKIQKNQRELKNVVKYIFIRLPYMGKIKNYQSDYFRFVSLLNLIQPSPEEGNAGL